MKILLTLSLFLLIFSCVHKPENKTRLSTEDELKHYEMLKTIILEEKAKDLQECNGMKAFYRDLKGAPDQTSRYAYDRTLGEHAIYTSEGRSKVTLFAIGPGVLLHELTAYSYILALGKDLTIYENDWAYIFYGQENFEETAVKWAENRKLIPEGWKGFFFWDRHKPKKDHLEHLLPLLQRHHRAIDQFKSVLQKIAKHYKRKVRFEIINPPKTKKIQLPQIDIVTSIDSFQDVPNLMYNFFYSFSLEQSPVRFVALNKTKPLGDFWDAPEGKEREDASRQDVHIDVYDIAQRPGFGSYQRVERLNFSATESQIKDSVNYIKHPKAGNEKGLLDDKNFGKIN